MGLEEEKDVWIRDERRRREEACRAVDLGCVLCGAQLAQPPKGDPFSTGPMRGRFMCLECWTLWWAEHPEDLADDESRDYVRRDAERIRFERALRDADEAEKKRFEQSVRGSEVIFSDGESRVFLSPNGTVVFRIEKLDALGRDEFDPARFAILVRAIQAVGRAGLPEFTF